MTTRDFIVPQSGHKLYLWFPAAYPFSIREVARALARAPRFAGQTRRRYSVAAHSIWCARESLRVTSTPRTPAQRWRRGCKALACLLHDAHEAYIGDIPTPVAAAIDRPRILQLKAVLQHAILKTFHLADALERPDFDLWVEAVDRSAFYVEGSALHPGLRPHLAQEYIRSVRGLSPALWFSQAHLDERRFLGMYYRLRSMAGF